MMQSTVDGPQVCRIGHHPFQEFPSQTHHFLQAPSFSGMKYEHLTRLSIEAGGLLSFKENFEKRLDVIDALGAMEHWSSDELYRHLKVLQTTVSIYTKRVYGNLTLNLSE